MQQFQNLFTVVPLLHNGKFLLFFFLSLHPHKTILEPSASKQVLIFFNYNHADMQVNRIESTKLRAKERILFTVDNWYGYV